VLGASGLKVLLAETWNGASWRRQGIPSPPVSDIGGSASPALTGVSCPSSGFCEAVGTYQNGFRQANLAETWNGTNWTRQRLPVPAGSFSQGLTAVSCTSAQFCEAVGSYSASSGQTVPYAATWNGTAWRLQHPRSPVNEFFSGFSSVSCVSPAFCEAWGGPTDGNSGAAVTEQWNGTSWLRQDVPPSADSNSVSCASTTFCEAVSATTAAAYEWNGSTWRTQTIPSPVPALKGVSCASPASCEAVSTYNDNGSGQVIAAVWNGSAWSVQSLPNPARAADAYLNAVSCPAAGSCEAAGYFEVNQTADDPQALAEGWNGSSWQLQSAAAPKVPTDTTLAAVSCPSASFCEAVGNHDSSSGEQANLAEEWNGTSWTIQDTPDTHTRYGATDDELFDVSCVSASFCEAVGVGAHGADAELWNGTSWTIQARPGAEDVQPQTVSCVSANFCVSADAYGDVDLWNGSSWSAGPGLTGLLPVSGLSCVSARFCEAVGGGSSGQDAAVWNGSTWSGQATQGPVSTALSAVSCSGPDSCEAVGTYANSDQLATLAEGWNGTEWTQQVIPNPTTSYGSYLQGVSCAAATSCTAVGQYQNGYPGVTDTLAEVWDGTAWTLQNPRNRTNAGQNIFNGVSCYAARACTAAGDASDRGGVQDALVETGG
jgi:hypothetical protein